MCRGWDLKLHIKQLRTRIYAVIASIIILHCNKYEYECISFIIYQYFSAVKEALSDHARSKSGKAHRRIPSRTSGTSAGLQPPSVGDLFQRLSVSEKEELLFIQLPDTMPVPVKALKSEKSVKKTNPEDKRAPHPKAQVSRAFGIRSLSTEKYLKPDPLFVLL